MVFTKCSLSIAGLKVQFPDTGLMVSMHENTYKDIFCQTSHNDMILK